MGPSHSFLLCSLLSLVFFTSFCSAAPRADELLQVRGDVARDEAVPYMIRAASSTSSKSKSQARATTASKKKSIPTQAKPKQSAKTAKSPKKSPKSTAKKQSKSRQASKTPESAAPQTPVPVTTVVVVPAPSPTTNSPAITTPSVFLTTTTVMFTPTDATIASDIQSLPTSSSTSNGAASPISALYMGPSWLVPAVHALIATVAAGALIL